MSCGKGMSGQSPQALVDQRPVFDNGHKHRKTVHSRKAVVMRPTKKYRKARFI